MAAKRGHRGITIAAGVLLAYLLACRLFPAFARLALNRLTRPALLFLHRLTAPIPFPLAEAVACSLALALCGFLALSLFRALRRRVTTPLIRWLRGAAACILLLGGALLILWLPAMLAPAEAPPVPSADRLEWLCGDLIRGLNESPLAFPEAAESLRRAPEAAGLPGAAVKSARYPEWMRAASISGLFVPLTGEALVDATAPAPLIPFTAVHELTHLAGIADEGAANIAAWERCLAAGGAFADSARLWALRYAMGLLLREDPDAWRRARDMMKDPLSQVFSASGGEAAPSSPAGPGLPRLSLRRGDYTALAGWLASRGE